MNYVRSSVFCPLTPPFSPSLVSASISVCISESEYLMLVNYPWRASLHDPRDIICT